MALTGILALRRRRVSVPLAVGRRREPVPPAVDPSPNTTDVGNEGIAVHGVLEPGHSTTGAGQPVGSRIRALLVLIPAGFLCTSSLGFSWDEPTFEVLVRSPWLFSFSVIAVVVFLLALRWFWRGTERLATETLVFSLMVPAVVGILTFLLKEHLSPPLYFVFLTFSVLAFLALLWTGLLLLEATGTATATVLTVFILALLVVFALSVLLSTILPLSLIVSLGPVMMLIYLLFLVAFGIGEIRRDAGGRPASLLHMGEERIARISAEYALSKRETEVIALLLKGLPATVIGRQLYLSPETIKTHKSHIYQKLGVHSHAELVVLFESYGDSD
jgi:DNA-binding CsgD family transcriptional regulator